MDEIDLKITRILFSNSRTSYREIGEQVGQSTTTVYKRVQEMVDSKIIQKFRTHLDIGALGALMVWIFGSTSISSEDVFIKNMSRNDRVKLAVYGAGNYAHVGLYIKDISELEENVNYVKNMGN